jgi:hypothetical protein
MLLAEEIDANMIRRAPEAWVYDIWERLRSVRMEDVGHSNEQFVGPSTYLAQASFPTSVPRRSRTTSVLLGHKPATVPEHVGVVIMRHIQQIEMSGPTGDTSRDLMAIIQRYNSGKAASSSATAAMASSNVQKSNYSNNNNYSNDNNYSNNNNSHNAPAPHGRGSTFCPPSRQVCKFCQKGPHLKENCWAKYLNKMPNFG